MPGAVISRLAVGSLLACLARCLSTPAISASIASIWRNSGASAWRTPSQTRTSPFSSWPVSASFFKYRRSARPCGAMTPISARWPRKAFNKATR